MTRSTLPSAAATWGSGSYFSERLYPGIFIYLEINVVHRPGPGHSDVM
jgi:hypothetical protein